MPGPATTQSQEPTEKFQFSEPVVTHIGSVTVVIVRLHTAENFEKKIYESRFQFLNISLSLSDMFLKECNELLQCNSLNYKNLYEISKMEATD